jgi:hypothetical protein
VLRSLVCDSVAERTNTAYDTTRMWYYMVLEGRVPHINRGRKGGWKEGGGNCLTSAHR